MAAELIDIKTKRGLKPSRANNSGKIVAHKGRFNRNGLHKYDLWLEPTGLILATVEVSPGVADAVIGRLVTSWNALAELSLKEIESLASGEV